LYGDDIHTLVNQLRDFEKPDGTFEKINLCEMKIRCIKSYVMQQFHPFTLMLPFLRNYCLVQPFKREWNNLQRSFDAVKEIVSKSQDTKSIYHQAKKADLYDDEGLLQEMFTITGAAFQSSSEFICSSLYFLNKHPETLKKLRAELSENGWTKGADLKKVCTIDNIQNCEYLNMVVKEALRIDTPFPEAFPYQAYEDVEICGVPVKKGTYIVVDFISAHYDEKHWMKPKEFIPDRFDTESEFYNVSHHFF
jgi:cytochrome P450